MDAAIILKLHWQQQIHSAVGATTPNITCILKDKAPSAASAVIDEPSVEDAIPSFAVKDRYENTPPWPRLKMKPSLPPELSNWYINTDRFLPG